MTIAALPTPPQTTDAANFDSRADAWVSALQNWTTQVNNLATTLDVDAASASSAAAAAALSAAAAAASQLLAVAGANYKGEWSTLTGALALPASVSHLGYFWALNTTLANVTTAVPGTSSSWTLISASQGPQPDESPRNRDLGSAAWLSISRLPDASRAGEPAGITAGTPVAITLTMPGIRIGDFITGVSMSIAWPANLEISARISAADSVRLTYTSLSGTVTPGSHTVYVRAEKRIPE